MSSFQHAELLNFSLEELDKFAEGTTLKKFDAEDAWQLGSLIRDYAKQLPIGIVIDITLASGQVVFHSTVGKDVYQDNDEWVNRKKRVVLRFGKPSFYIGQKLRQKGKPINEALLVDALQYAPHGGSIPLRIEGHDGLIGAVTISGLPQTQDHYVVTECLKRYRKVQDGQ